MFHLFWTADYSKIQVNTLGTLKSSTLWKKLNFMMFHAYSTVDYFFAVKFGSALSCDLEPQNCPQIFHLFWTTDCFTANSGQQKETDCLHKVGETIVRQIMLLFNFFLSFLFLQRQEKCCQFIPCQEMFATVLSCLLSDQTLLILVFCCCCCWVSFRDFYHESSVQLVSLGVNVAWNPACLLHIVCVCVRPRTCTHV